MAEIQYKPLEKQYIDDLYKLWSDPAVIRYTGMRESCTLEQTSQRLYQLQQYDVFVICKHHEFAGIIGCPCIDTKNAQFGLFYQLKQSVWGQGYATSSVKWILNYMETKYAHPIFYADVITENIASEKILKSCHFTCRSESKPIHSAGRAIVVRHYVRIFPSCSSFLP